MLMLTGMTALQADNEALPKQILYYGGDIITMEGDKPSYVDAVMVFDGKIIYAGKKSDAVNNYAGETEEINLNGRTMMPGLIEPRLLATVLSSDMADVLQSVTIKKGNAADFTIFARNPFKTDKKHIKKIEVAGIVLGGELKMKKEPLIGGDKDAHGCIGSAGYKWCAKTNRCERPWELAKKEKFEKRAEAFDAFCGNRN